MNAYTSLRLDIEISKLVTLFNTEVHLWLLKIKAIWPHVSVLIVSLNML